MQVVFTDSTYSKGVIMLKSGATDVFYMDERGRIRFIEGNYPHYNKMCNAIRKLAAHSVVPGVWHDVVLKNR